MFSLEGSVTTGTLGVVATSGRGMNPDEITNLTVDKLLHIADSTPPAIREQAIAFKDRMRVVVRYYVEQAQRSERTTMINVLEQAGQHDAAELLRKI